MALTALRSGSSPAPNDLSVMQLADRPEVLLGIDDEQQPHLLLGRAGVDEDTPASDVATLSVDTRTLVIAGETTGFLDVTCLFASVAEVFEHFIVAVVERLDTGSHSPSQALADVLEKWRQFLAPTASPPGRDRLASVFGELLVLLDIADADARLAVDCWVGPFGGRHDIRRAGIAIEVKTTRSHTSRKVTIHGEDQLEPPEGGTLHLHLVRLEEVPGGGSSVVDLVDGLLSRGVPAEEMFDALSAAGVPVVDLAGTAEITFDVRERLTVPIDDGTSRIIAASFVGGERPVGVIDVNYVIDLDHSLDRILDANAYSSLIRAVGTAGA